MKTMILMLALCFSFAARAEDQKAADPNQTFRTLLDSNPNGATVFRSSDQADPDKLFRWEWPDRLEVGVHIATLSLMWVDVLQSRDMRNPQTRLETNPVFVRLAGTNTPSKGQFFWIGGVGASAVETAVWLALPHRWRMVLDFVVAGEEAVIVYQNHQIGLRMTF